MSIKPITEAMWPQIVALQAEAYFQVEPESLDVLKSKWLISPASCFVYEKAGKLVAYLLAHCWHSETAPKLYQMLPDGTTGPILFLHDLAISKAAAGDGLGTKMVSYLIKTAKEGGFQQINLVAVQQSGAFWQKQGFLPVDNQQLCPGYGDGAQLMSLRF
ncbi:MAG: GNAT family N-acetyltransferase [Gammaproteobacteria bacterium]|nr:GNAT family N-acetyltransferase [Gammaproteobacteria bacterium]MBU1553961.1 GNAT family N-acetyltransferase [Gammaproteobacteria bacterium]MBU2069534.1 GNAT family N-acetyltransferase [Gammaproteobacteria bacterium]MBU2183080.1 GNAT family N-acetyltransferase [Gammaproteobacteria bacterium]MBU2203092.1 GNAT family N-acetyltransferase [Gammaproteobacteria bacterium]